MKQQYHKYTTEDFQVWEQLFIRQMKILPELASAKYLEGIKNIGFRKDRIPNFDEMNEVLEKRTGWGLTVVPNIIPNEAFFPILASKRFTATTWLRSIDQLNYLEEPDMFHDVFGHVPLLTNPTFCNFFHGLAQIALKHLDDQEAIEMIGRMYWFTIEFGLIQEAGKLKIYGAGILSSYEESLFCVSNKPEHKPFNVHEIMHTQYDNMKIQNKYFVIDSYEQLFNSLGKIEHILEKRLQANTIKNA